VGPEGDDGAALAERASRADLASAVTFAGFVSDAALAGLYRHCAALVHPSLLEGFGLPVVEAMACGAPVIASSEGAVPEAAGKAVAAFDGADVDALVDALGSVLDDEERRRRLVSAGAAHAARHGAAAAARRAADLYAELAPRGDHP